MRSKGAIHSKLILLNLLVVVLFAVDMVTGSVSISMSQLWAALSGGDCPETIRRIVLNIRLVKAFTALIAGAALSVSGVLMQTLFRNPLAGPYVLGISSGAGLGVALLVLGAPLLACSTAWLQSLGIAGAAWLGAAAVLSLIAAVGQRVKDIMVVLILGMMFSSGIGAVVQILQYLSDEESLKNYVLWTMGSLGDVTLEQLPLVAGAVAMGLILAFASSKDLNLLLFGPEYAATMGMNIRRSRAVLFISTALLAGTVTAFCGPIGFIGLAMPHVARMILRNSDHLVLLPASILVGAASLLLCDIISKQLSLPVNALTSLLGVPVVIWVVIKSRTLYAR